MFSKCNKCNFHLRQTDGFCPNCGVITHNQELNQPRSITWNIPLLISLVIIFYFIGSLIFATIIPNYVLILSFIFSFGISIPFHQFIVNQNIREKSEKLKRYNENNLTKTYFTVSQRLAELSHRRNRFDAILNRISKSSSKNLEQIQQKLLSAQQIIKNQCIRYNLQKKKIELIRLQNEVLPYLEMVDILKDYQIENGVVVTEKVIREVAINAQDLSENHSNSLQYEQQQFLKQLKETSESCERLQEVLLSKQALRALQTVQPIEEFDLPMMTNEFSQTIATFNIQTTLTDFSESFEQLENEYRRLLADNEVSQKLLNFES
ncbi:MAG TPA: zinc ribbon domain-containing protein [Pyrinomonadaceae bacterium]|nr:zinc ribbon domain-containing protein [Pyrinomonadaceae bacterium]